MRSPLEQRVSGDRLQRILFVTSGRYSTHGTVYDEAGR